jgi:uncharacterized protein
MQAGVRLFSATRAGLLAISMALLYTALMITLLWMFLIALAGAFLQTNIGFGLPVIAMMFLPVFLPFSTSVAIYQIVAMLSTTYITLYYRKYIAWRIMLPLLGVSMAVSILVTLGSMRMAKGSLMVMLGIALMIISVFSIRFSDRIRIQPTARAGASMGMIAGVGNGLFGIGGPPVAIYLLAGTEEKRTYLATLQCYFLISNVTTITIRAGAGAVEAVHISLILSGWAGIGLGTFLGLKLFERLPKALLQKLVYSFVGVSGAWMVIQEFLRKA